MPRVSAVVPTYNRPEMLAETVRSILNQGFDDLEVLVVSDGPWLYDPFATINDSRVRFLNTDVHYGRPAPARNVGVAAASGQILAFCDDDDLWEPDKLGLQMNIFDRDPTVVLVHTHAVNIDAEGRTIGVRKGSRRRYDAHPLRGFLSLPYYWIVQSSIAARRSAFNAAGLFDERPLLAGREDAEWLIRVAARTGSRFARVPAPLVRYRTASGSLSHRPDFMDYKKLDCFFSTLIEKGTLTPLQHALLVSNLNVSLALNCLKNGKGADCALRFSREAWRARPGLPSGIALAFSWTLSLFASGIGPRPA